MWVCCSSGAECRLSPSGLERVRVEYLYAVVKSKFYRQVHLFCLPRFGLIRNCCGGCESMSSANCFYSHVVRRATYMPEIYSRALSTVSGIRRAASLFMKSWNKRPQDRAGTFRRGFHRHLIRVFRVIRQLPAGWRFTSLCDEGGRHQLGHER